MKHCAPEFESGVWPSKREPALSESSGLAMALSLFLLMATTAVTYFVRANTWTRVDAMADWLADSSAALVVFVLLSWAVIPF